MGKKINIDFNEPNYHLSRKKPANEFYNLKVALWQIPYDKRYADYDEDGSRWFELVNKEGNDEIEKVEQELGISLTRYKVASKTTEYKDGTYDIETLYQNGNRVKETYGENHVFVTIKDNLNRLVAEKIFNKFSTDGRKIIYNNITKDDNTFTIVKIYSYDTSKNRKSDTVNYGYTSNESILTKGCEFEKEYYMLNGKEVNAEKINDSEYRVKNQNGEILTFTVE